MRVHGFKEGRGGGRGRGSLSLRSPHCQSPVTRMQLLHCTHHGLRTGTPQSSRAAGRDPGEERLGPAEPPRDRCPRESACPGGTALHADGKVITRLCSVSLTHPSSQDAKVSAGMLPLVHLLSQSCTFASLSNNPDAVIHCLFFKNSTCLSIKKKTHTHTAITRVLILASSFFKKR